MTQRIHDRIRTILEITPGLTQKGLAERMGLNPSAINRMLYDKRKIQAEEIPMIEEYLGVRLELSAPTVAANVEYRQDNRAVAPRRGFSDAPPAHFSHARGDVDISAQMVPVYSYAEGGLKNGEAVDWVVRHPSQFGIANAFAVYVSSDQMAPRYFRGELVYIHPGRPPEPNRDCLVEMTNGEAHIQRFIHQDKAGVRVAQFNPPREENISKENIKAVYAVVGRG